MHVFYSSMVLSDPHCDKQQITDLVTSHIPDACLGREHGKELTYTLPLSSLQSFAGECHFIYPWCMSGQRAWKGAHLYPPFIFLTKLCRWVSLDIPLMHVWAESMERSSPIPSLYLPYKALQVSVTLYTPDACVGREHGKELTYTLPLSSLQSFAGECHFIYPWCMCGQRAWKGAHLYPPFIFLTKLCRWVSLYIPLMHVWAESMGEAHLYPPFIFLTKLCRWVSLYIPLMHVWAESMERSSPIPSLYLPYKALQESVTLYTPDACLGREHGKELTYTLPLSSLQCFAGECHLIYPWCMSGQRAWKGAHLYPPFIFLTKLCRWVSLCIPLMHVWAESMERSSPIPSRYLPYKALQMSVTLYTPDACVAREYEWELTYTLPLSSLQSFAGECHFIYQQEMEVLGVAILVY